MKLCNNQTKSHPYVIPSAKELRWLIQGLPECNMNLHWICLLSFRTKEQKDVFHLPSGSFLPPGRSVMREYLQSLQSIPKRASCSLLSVLYPAQASTWCLSEMLISLGSTKASHSLSLLSNSKTEQTSPCQSCTTKCLWQQQSRTSSNTMKFNSNSFPVFICPGGKNTPFILLSSSEDQGELALIAFSLSTSGEWFI